MRKIGSLFLQIVWDPRKSYGAHTRLKTQTCCTPVSPHKQHSEKQVEIVHKRKREREKEEERERQNGTFIRWYLIKRCAGKAQSLLFDLFKAFHNIERSHKSDPKRPIFLHACATCYELPSNISTMERQSDKVFLLHVLVIFTCESVCRQQSLPALLLVLYDMEGGVPSVI